MGWLKSHHATVISTKTKFSAFSISSEFGSAQNHSGTIILLKLQSVTFVKLGM